MGPQTDMSFTDVLQQIEDADRGQLYELTTGLGLGYRTRINMQNQVPPVVTLNYSGAQLAGALQPLTDDSLTRNDVTVSRINGGSLNIQQTTGDMAIANPPIGVGDYSYSLS